MLRLVFADLILQDLQAIFKSKHPEYTIVNHKVLKDENGLSRGVGFARYCLFPLSTK